MDISFDSEQLRVINWRARTKVSDIIELIVLSNQFPCLEGSCPDAYYYLASHQPLCAEIDMFLN